MLALDQISARKSPRPCAANGTQVPPLAHFHAPAIAVKNGKPYISGITGMTNSSVYRNATCTDWNGTEKIAKEGVPMHIQANQSVRMFLKCVHIFSVCVWIGGGLAVLVLLYNDKQTSNGDELFAYNHAIKSIDDYLIKPAAIGTFTSGALICLLTNWGLTKHRWIIVKWAVTLAAIAFGALFLGPWLKELSTITGMDRLAVFDDNGYFRAYHLGVVFGFVQTAVLLFLVLISIFKPAFVTGKNGMAGTKP
ncbi:MAG: hypothetical protein FD174_1919 [Geobacteraceae bacterium]|nr:MAG: hypothetical protein FD174_1919 [Geobacteraceae bacterium]